MTDSGSTAFEPWFCCAQPAGAIAEPADLLAAKPDWLPASVPGTAASALRDSGRWSFDQPFDLDAHDWWYRTTFEATEAAQQTCHLCFDGLATLAEVWLNGQRLLATDNMFRSYRVEISNQLQAHNELVIGFRSLANDLKKKRPRPRWKTNLVSNQQLRWHRTSLLGHIPGWSPPVPAVGPWRPVRIETQPVRLSDLRLFNTYDGTDGVVCFQAKVDASTPIERARLRVGEYQVAAEPIVENGQVLLRARLPITNPAPWWPHTHGDQPLYPCDVTVESANVRQTFDCGKVGFRQLQVAGGEEFAIRVNEVPVYCRGACWTTSDLFTLHGSEDELERQLRLARDAGVNMLRVGGTMIYESDRFYRICDELGILIWQDFMFANMDYPVEDEGFASNINAEAVQQLCRLAPHPSVAVYCGNSEVEQQAAMLGMPRELWRNAWFGEHLSRLCAEHDPGTVYVPSTPSGGTLPFHTRSGVTHYYGIGAYLRQPSELRQADVKFTSECLGFANVPEPESLERVFEGTLPVVHSPKWKQRVPRDSGAGWDFDDVRDFYLQYLYGVDPVRLRSFDMPRYLQLGRTVSGEMMSQTFSEWRSIHSNNGGGLVWFFKDLWHGAGWGILDADGFPKPAYYYLRRVWQTRQVVLTDEGLDGIHLHVINETADSLSGFLELTLLKEPNVVVARHELPIELPARSRKMWSADDMLGSFYDVNYAYRFGPPHHDVVIATLLDGPRQVISEAFRFVQRRDPVVAPARLELEAHMISDSEYQLTLVCDRLLHGVRLAAKGYLPRDNYFHLVPSRPKTVLFSAVDSQAGPFRASVEALNLDEVRFVAVKKAATTARQPVEMTSA
jgi:beta-mannosidase